MNACWKWVLICCLLMSGLVVSAQTRPRVGLALSGGGAKGFAHIGVLKVLEAIKMPVDCIAGTSMGSIIGGLYAIGYTAAELESLATKTDWDTVLKDQVDRRFLSMEQKFYDARYNISLDLDRWRVRLPSGLIAGQNVLQLLNRLTQPAQHINDFTKFPRPFVCVATDIVTGEAVVLKEGSLAESIRASMAIPSAFTPMKINNKLLVDGMLVRNFPVQETREVLAADIVIGVDVGELLAKESELNSFLNIMNQAVSFQMVASTIRQRALCDYLIIPDVGSVGAGSFKSAGYLIRQGEAAAMAMLPRLKALADSLNSMAILPVDEGAYLYQAMQSGDSLYITDVRIEGLTRLPKNFVMERLKLVLPGQVTLGDIELGVDRIFGSQFFERVSYELQPNFHGKRLVIRVLERSSKIFRIGLRYDTKDEVAMLLNTTFRNQGRPGSFLTLDVKLGSNLLISGNYFTRTGFRRLIGLRWRLMHVQQSIDQFENGVRFARQRVSNTIAESFIGTIFSNKFTLGGGLRLEFAKIDPTIAPIGFEGQSMGLLSFFGDITVDSYNRTNFPTQGVYFQASIEHATNKLFSERDFTRAFVDARFLVPFTDLISFKTNLFVGSSVGDLPFHYQFILGGVDLPITFLGEWHSFYGFRRNEFLGRNVQFAQMGAQIEILPHRYVLIWGNSGNTFDNWQIKIDPERYFYGGGVTFGMDSRLGPLELTFMSSERHGLLTHINMGYKF